jgi:molybdenum cofactor sulfurtransferase
LLDAASYLITTPLDFSIVAPDFTVLSSYKIFRLPDLGAIIVRRDASHILFQWRYFGGGTRTALKPYRYHVTHKEIHKAMEDGTLPFHTILALDAAFNNYARMFGSHANVSRHAILVSRLMHTLLSSLRYDNGNHVCQLFSTPDEGPIAAFNVLIADGNQIGFATIVHTKLCIEGWRTLQFRRSPKISRHPELGD